MSPVWGRLLPRFTGITRGVEVTRSRSQSFAEQGPPMRRFGRVHQLCADIRQRDPRHHDGEEF